VAGLGKVSVCRRGSSYWIYFRDSGKSIRKKIDGNLATAKATASQVNVNLEQKQPSPILFGTRFAHVWKSARKGDPDRE